MRDYFCCIGVSSKTTPIHYAAVLVYGEKWLFRDRRGQTDPNYDQTSLPKKSVFCHASRNSFYPKIKLD